MSEKLQGTFAYLDNVTINYVGRLCCMWARMWVCLEGGEFGWPAEAYHFCSNGMHINFIFMKDIQLIQLYNYVIFFQPATSFGPLTCE